MNTIFIKYWNHPWALSISAGILLGFSFPPFPFPFLQIPAFILLLQVVRLSDSAKQAAYYTYPGFLIWNSIATYWLMMATIAGGLASILANAVLMALTIMLIYWAQEKCKSAWFTAFLQTCFWVSFEYLHFQWDLSWPWLTLGNGWAYYTNLIQYISVTGVMGVSAWVVLTAALAFQFIKTDKKIIGYSALSLFLLLPIISLIQLSTLSFDSNKTIEVAVVQPNFDTYKTNGGFESPLQSLSHLLKLSNKARTDETDLILWPENSIFPYLSDSKNPSLMLQTVKERIFAKARQWNTVILGGAGYIDFFNKKPPALAITSMRPPYLQYNAAVAFSPDGTTTVYRKHNLVPIVERLPFVNFFNTIDVFDWVNWSRHQGFGQGNEATLIPVDSTGVAALVCYDSVYPGWIRHFTQKDAGLLTVITNDGWWGKSSGHIQHFAYARLAAIEFRRWVVRSANNGISGIIAADGSVKVKTNYWTQTSFHYKVPILTGSTLYTQFGNWLPLGMIGVSILSLIFFRYFRR